jgi:hypothetical protein
MLSKFEIAIPKKVFSTQPVILGTDVLCAKQNYKSDKYCLWDFFFPNRFRVPDLGFRVQGLGFI